MTATATRPERATTEPLASTELARGPTTSYVRVGLAVLLAALVGFGAGWLVFRDTGPDVPAEVSTLIDDYRQAWNDVDGDAAVALMTPGATFSSSAPAYGPVSGDDLVAHIDRMSATSIGEGTIESVVGDDPTIVTYSQRVAGRDGYSVFEIVEWGGELLIRTHTWNS